MKRDLKSNILDRSFLHFLQDRKVKGVLFLINAKDFLAVRSKIAFQQVLVCHYQSLTKYSI